MVLQQLCNAQTLRCSYKYPCLIIFMDHRVVTYDNPRSRMLETIDSIEKKSFD